jgi:DNA-binding ferritin-like protein
MTNFPTPPATAESLGALREELGGYIDSLAERVAAVEALGGEARQAIANAHEVEEHYDELKRRLTIVAALLAGAGHEHELELVERVLGAALGFTFER